MSEFFLFLEASYFYYQKAEYGRDCKEVFDQCSASNSSGVYLIKPDGYPHPFEVYCNNSIDSGGWTVSKHLREPRGSKISIFTLTGLAGVRYREQGVKTRPFT